MTFFRNGEFDEGDFKQLCIDAKNLGVDLTTDNRRRFELQCTPDRSIAVYDSSQEGTAMDTIARTIFDAGWELDAAIAFSIAWNKKDVFKIAITRHDTDLAHGECFGQASVLPSWSTG